MKLCEHHDSSKLFIASDYLSGENFDLKECLACGEVYTQLPSGIDLGSYYPTSYHGKKKRLVGGLDALSNFLISRRVKKLNIDLRAQGAILDIGCGQGWFLKQFAEWGWNCTGVEASETAAYHAREELKLPVVTGSDALSNLPDSSFDVVCIWHVLEHIVDYKDTVKQIHRVLKTGGKLLLGVPNFDSLESRFGKAGWFHLDPPRHVVHFNRNRLETIFSESGLKLSRANDFSPEFDFFSFVQTAQNRMGLPYNLLYSKLRGRKTSKQLATIASLKDEVLLFLTLIPLVILSAIYVPLMLLIDSPGCIAYIAQKEDD